MTGIPEYSDRELSEMTYEDLRAYERLLKEKIYNVQVEILDRKIEKIRQERSK